MRENRIGMIMIVDFDDNDDEFIATASDVVSVYKDYVVINIPDGPELKLPDDILDYMVDCPETIKEFTQSEFILDLFCVTQSIRSEKRNLYESLGFSRY
jgi:hypothetical protein